MKITNEAGLPQSVYEALSNNEYSRGDADISVTELIDSPRVRALKKKHDSEISIEAEGLLPSFLGTCFHKGIEGGTKTGTVERRLSIEVDGWKISGGMDHYHDGALTDYKTATTWKVMLDCPEGRIVEWENQLNVYAHILRTNGYPVEDLKIFVYFKDWNKGSLGKAKSIFKPGIQGGYPAKSWLYFNLNLWTPVQADGYIESRVYLHKEAEKYLPQCSKKELWNGNRCKSYCSVVSYCDQYNKIKTTGLISQQGE